MFLCHVVVVVVVDAKMLLLLHLLTRQLFCLFANKPDDFTCSLMLLLDCVCIYMQEERKWQRRWCGRKLLWNVHFRVIVVVNNFRIYWTSFLPHGSIYENLLIRLLKCPQKKKSLACYGRVTFHVPHRSKWHIEFHLIKRFHSPTFYSLATTI